MTLHLARFINIANSVVVTYGEIRRAAVPCTKYVKLQ
jgi:hypothetical protein